jgi:hypothetical protein
VPRVELKRDNNARQEFDTNYYDYVRTGDEVKLTASEDMSDVVINMNVSGNVFVLRFDLNRGQFSVGDVVEHVLNVADELKSREQLYNELRKNLEWLIIGLALGSAALGALLCLTVVIVLRNWTARGRLHKSSVETTTEYDLRPLNSSKGPI